MIERIAISTGTSPANTAPKTSTSTMSAAGSPKASSPVSRSSCDCLPKSWFAVWSPVIADLEGAAVRLLHDLLDLGGAGVAVDADRREQRVAVGRDGQLADLEHLSRRLQVVGEALDERLELRRVDRVALRGDDGHVAFSAGVLVREGAGDGVLGLRRLRAADDVGVRGQPVQRGRHERESDQDGGAPERERQPWTRRAPPCEPLGQSHAGSLTRP